MTASRRNRHAGSCRQFPGPGLGSRVVNAFDERATEDAQNRPRTVAYQFSHAAVMDPTEGRYVFSKTDRWIEWAVGTAKLPLVGGREP